MSKFLDRFRYFKQKGETFADGHGQLLNTNRDWEDGYRQRWQHDKIVRSTHGVNCTGSCSWKIYVKNGLVTWETQQTDYPRTRPDRSCVLATTRSTYCQPQPVDFRSLSAAGVLRMDVVQRCCGEPTESRL